MTLRTRLLLAILALVAAGLVVAGVVTYLSLRGFLLERVDAQLRDARVPIAMALTDGSQERAARQPGGGPGGANLPPGTYGQLRDASGNVLNAISFTYSSEDQPTPVLPDPLPSPAGGRHAASSSPPARRPAARRQASASSSRTCPTSAASSSSPSRSPRRRQTLTRLLTIEVVVSLRGAGERWRPRPGG